MYPLSFCFCFKTYPLYVSIIFPRNGSHPNFLFICVFFHVKKDVKVVYIPVISLPILMDRLVSLVCTNLDNVVLHGSELFMYRIFFLLLLYDSKVTIWVMNYCLKKFKASGLSWALFHMHAVHVISLRYSGNPSFFWLLRNSKQQKWLAKKRRKKKRREMKVFVHACVNIFTKERRCHVNKDYFIAGYKMIWVFVVVVVSCMDHEWNCYL